MINIGDFLAVALPFVLIPIWLIANDIDKENKHKEQISQYLKDFEAWRNSNEH